MIDTDQYQDTIDARRTCKRCQRQVRNMEDGECADDCSQPGQVDMARQAEAIRRLHLSTARMLLDAGHDEEAAYHFIEAERGR
jgi:hypothetical protein